MTGQNLLLVVLDTARADAFEPYGAPPGSSPALTQLASRGQALERMYSTACWTVPAHASMLSGLMPEAIGLGQAPGSTGHGCRAPLEANRDRLLPEVLRKAGYDTRAVSTNAWIAEYSGFATGFDDFVSTHIGRQAALHTRGPIGRAHWDLEAARARVDDGAGRAAEILEAWTGERHERPFFWFVNLVECHSPYLPPRPYNNLGLLDRIRAGEEARRHLTLEAIWRACVGEFDVPEDALERMRCLYAGAVKLMDDWVARVLDTLDRAGLLDDTLVVVTADHGENFGEGELMSHAFSLDDRLIHVPFFAAGPEASWNGAAHSLVELPAMLAGALGLAEHPWGESTPPLPVAQFTSLGPRDDPRIQDAARDWSLDDEGVSKLTSSFEVATDGSVKLLRRGDAEQCFVLASDPLELNPASPDTVDPAQLAALRAALDHPAVAARFEAPAATPADEPADLEERMRLLGYL